MIPIWIKWVKQVRNRLPQPTAILIPWNINPMLNKNRCVSHRFRVRCLWRIWKCNLHSFNVSHRGNYWESISLYMIIKGFFPNVIAVVALFILNYFVYTQHTCPSCSKKVATCNKFEKAINITVSATSSVLVISVKCMWPKHFYPKSWNLSCYYCQHLIHITGGVYMFNAAKQISSW